MLVLLILFVWAIYKNDCHLNHSKIKPQNTIPPFLMLRDQFPQIDHLAFFINTKITVNPHKTFPVLYKDKFQLQKAFWWISTALSNQLWVFHILCVFSSSLAVLLLLKWYWSNNNLPTGQIFWQNWPAINCWPDNDNKAPNSALIKMIAAMATAMATKVDCVSDLLRAC